MAYKLSFLLNSSSFDVGPSLCGIFYASNKSSLLESLSIMASLISINLGLIGLYPL